VSTTLPPGPDHPTPRHRIEPFPPDQFSLDDIAGEPAQGDPLARPLASPFSLDMTIAAARKVLEDLLEKGVICPTCGQNARIWRRQIHASMAHALIVVWQEAGTNKWVRVPDLLTHRQNADFAKLAHWGLIEEEIELRREDGGKAGVWRVTSLGERYMLGHVALPKYARVYAGGLLGFFGETRTIRQALGKKFDYDELMAGV
jgi:hypothetical protein